MKNSNEKLTGFTLSEVLITLMIIGVVSSLVIPAIIQDSREVELRTAWKKAYANYSQATAFIMANNGGTVEGLFTNAYEMRNTYLDYMSYTKKCSMNVSSEGCWHSANNWKYKTNVKRNSMDGIATGAILNNGNLVYFQATSSSCTSPTGNLLECGYITTDINGYKGPNTIGVDIFQVYVLKNTIVPAGIPGSNDDESCTLGWGCSVRYLNQ